MTSTNPTAGYGQFASNNPPPHGGNQNREGWPQSNGGRTIIGNTQSAEDNSISVGARPSLEESGAVSRRPSLDNSSEATSANIQWVQTTSDAHLVQTSRPASPISTSSTRRSRFMLQSQAFGKEGQEIRPPARRSAYQRITDFVARFWLFEIASTTVSAAVLVAIAIILKDSDNHILSAGGEEPDNWFFGQLTLNGLVALLSTVVEACMMVSVAAGISQLKWIRFGVLRSTRSGRRMAEFDDMDQASKGARGSLKFLLSRIPQLASIGAVITIFALAFDTFSQQVIAIETAVGNITQPANIPGVASYSLYMKDGQENAFTAPLPVTAAAYNGVFDSGNISPSLAQCDTGNCTWPIFPSLAVDGSCANITDTVIHKCTPHDGAYNCTYNVTDGSGYTLVQDSTSPLGVGGDFGSEYRLIVSPTFTGSAYQDPRMLYILNLLVLDLRGGTGPQAYACGLWLSIHTYNLTMVSGKQTQTVTGTWNKTNYDTQRRVETEAWYSFTDLPASIMPPNVPQMNGSMGLGVQFSDPPTVSSTTPFFRLPDSEIVQLLGLSICVRWTGSHFWVGLECVGHIRRGLICGVL